MLHFSALQIACVVFAAHVSRDTLLFSTSLILLCSSLIHHASGYACQHVARVDRALCLVFAAACVFRTIGKSPLIYVTNWSLGLYIAIIYYKLRLHESSKIAHASIHTAASLVGTLLCVSS
jgi:hypothetical protein